MTYILGGTPRSGKSTIKEILLDKYKIPGFTTDLIRDGLEKGVPSFGITDGMDDDFKKAEILWPYFKGIINAREDYSDNLLIEGTNFLPKYLTEFKDNKRIKICFVGYSEISVQEKFQLIRKNASPDDDWTNDESDESLMGLVKEFVETSKYFQYECEKYGIKYFDTSLNFKESIDQVLTYLLN